MQTIKAHKRVVIGRNITLSAAIVYSVAMCVYYATAGGVMDGTLAQDFLTADGRLFGVWSVAWGIAAVVCVADMVNRHTRYGLSFVVSLAASWGLVYLGIWCLNGCTDPRIFFAAIRWLALSGVVFGFLLKVTALQDMLRETPTPPGGADGN